MEKILEELKEETEKLSALLAEQETGLFTWWEFLNERLIKINELSKKLGINKN
jgi:hypothetical protein